MNESLLESRLFERIERKKAALDVQRPLPPAVVRRVEEGLSAEFIYNSNAIEGNTLTLRETQLILEQGITIGGKSLREHFEVVNHRQAIDYVNSLLDQTTPISAFAVRSIHQLILAQIDETNAGKYRDVPVRIIGAKHVPPEPWQLSRLMDEWQVWLHNQSLSLHPVELAGLAHHRLAAIHPFIDGNGRTARLVMNFILMRAGYPPTIIMQRNRQQYYRVLAQADEGRLRPLVNFIGRAVERGLTLYLEAVTPQLQPPSADTQWILLNEAAKVSPYSQEYLSLLARRGRLEAVKRGRNWYTTRAALAEYIKSLQT